MELKNQKGQTLVEYILLIVVMVSLVLTFYKSEAFRRLFGDEGLLGQKIKYQNEFAYRHAFSHSGQGGRPADVERNITDATNHPSYKGDPTRFFGPNDAYPQ